jgi:hypothetical protein
VAAEQSLVVFQWLASALVAIILVIGKVATLKPKRVESVFERDRPIAGVWVGDIDGQPAFIELKVVELLLEGSYVRGNHVATVNSATYSPPRLYFEIVKPDGSELCFDGRVNADSTEIRGHWSDFVDEYPWRMRRLKISPQFTTRPVWQNDSRTNFTDADAPVPHSPLAPLLVYCALDQILRAGTKVVPDYSVPIAAALLHASNLSEPLHQPSPCSASNNTSASADALLPFPPSPDQVMSLSHQADPQTAPYSNQTPVVQAYGRRCPKCDSEWQDAFAFCLHCGHVQ